MWVFLNDAYLSIVAPSEELQRKRNLRDFLIVRARRAGDIERVFPGTKVKRTPERDYLFRALVRRSRVATVLYDRLLDIDYPNFKNSVRNDERHDAYSRVWGAMHAYQRQQDAPPVDRGYNFSIFGDEDEHTRNADHPHSPYYGR